MSTPESNTHKKCSKCKDIKIRGGFGSCKTSKSGLKSACKECRNTDGLEYDKKNRVKRNEFAKGYRSKNNLKIKKSRNKHYCNKILRELRDKKDTIHASTASSLDSNGLMILVGCSQLRHFKNGYNLAIEYVERFMNEQMEKGG